MMWNNMEVDPHTKGGAYFVGTRYKLDDFTPYIYKTEDYGKTWKRIDNGINRMHFTRALRADRNRKGLLYSGTEYGMYISYNDGVNWKPFQLNLPEAPITDLAIKDNDLIVGTQGRSIYILDDLAVVQQADAVIINKNLHVFQPKASVRMRSAGGRFGSGGQGLSNTGKNPPNGVAIQYYVKDATDSTVASVTIMDNKRKLVKTFSTSSKEDTIEVNKGMNQFVWDLNYPSAEKIPEGLIVWNGNPSAPKSPPGDYFAKFKSGNDSAEVKFTIVADPNYKVSQQEYEEQFNFLIIARDKFSETIKALNQIKELRSQMTDFSSRLGKDLPKEVQDQITETGKKITEVEEALHQTKAKSGQDVLNFPIRLDDKLSNVYRNAFAGNGAPTKQVKEAYADIGGKIDVELNKLKAVMSDDVSKLNQLIHKKTLPVIGVNKE